MKIHKRFTAMCENIENHYPNTKFITSEANEEECKTFNFHVNNEPRLYGELVVEVNGVDIIRQRYSVLSKHGLSHKTFYLAYMKEKEKAAINLILDCAMYFLVGERSSKVAKDLKKKRREMVGQQTARFDNEAGMYR